MECCGLCHSVVRHAMRSRRGRPCPPPTPPQCLRIALSVAFVTFIVDARFVRWNKLESLRPPIAQVPLPLFLGSGRRSPIGVDVSPSRPHGVLVHLIRV